MPYSAPLSLHSFSRAIVHIDGDAFFASCEQARNPSFKGKPLITGKERGIASSLSYEAKSMGVKRRDEAVRNKETLSPSDHSPLRL